ncbi:hypothetical protein FDP41_012675 [Naegleria fowleri]|uniref:Uncharacterized protein n=1 Tax=Naegleria fowleri TaxID=5763 RepID=A0A6A5BUJ8_NAEFO|nr:uncharacterized protein FDP41_012675 [Naegleria fowleri]KAF0980887.1 hypothetical protein FDP41_012675 [Naegleria fowleri]CAG4717212.1 unnamed protein product [Naegleria fowleri]
MNFLYRLFGTGAAHHHSSSSANVEKDLRKKRRMLQLTEDQIHVQEETYETLTETIKNMKLHLESIRQREQEMILLQIDTERELQEDYENYLQKGKKDEEYEKKYEVSRKFLEETMAAKKQEIKAKMEQYEARIKSLELKAQEILKTKQVTEDTNYLLNEEVQRLETQRQKEFVAGDNYDQLGEEEDLEASSNIPLSLQTVPVQPQIHDDQHPPQSSSESNISPNSAGKDLWERKDHSDTI